MINYTTKAEVKTALVKSFTNFRSFTSCSEAIRNFGLSVVFGEKAMNEQIQENIEAKLAAEHIEFNRLHAAERVPSSAMMYSYGRLKNSTKRLTTAYVTTNKSPVETILILFKKYKTADHVELVVSNDCHIIGRREKSLVVFSSKDLMYHNIVVL